MTLLNRILVLALLLSAIGCGSEKGKGTQGNPSAADIKSEPELRTDSRPVIVALGDSLTEGLRVEEADNYPSQLQRLVDASGFKFRVVNEGISGDTTAQGLQRLSSILSLHPTIVILELGANDGLRGLPPEQTRANLDEIIRRLREGGAQVILAGMEVPPNYGPEYVQKFRSIFRDLARKYQLPLIPFFLAGVGGIPELNQEDGIHPTARGYTKVTANVWSVLEPLLQRIARR